VGIRSPSILAGEIGIVTGTGQSDAWLQFHDDGMEISTEKEVGQGGDNGVSITG